MNPLPNTGEVEGSHNETAPHPRFSYADYEKAIRGPFYDRIWRVSQENAFLFRGCTQVLDIASGQGLFLEALREINVPAVGVDNEPNLIAECRAKGLDVVEEDVFHFLATTDRRFDGAACGHLIEHLPFDPFLDLIEGVRRVLSPGGIFVVRWPNSRSAVTQLQSFWKDPTHSRFYDGEFVRVVLEFYGFEIVERHYDTIEPTSMESSTAVGHSSSVTPAGFDRQTRRTLRQVVGAATRRLLTHPLRLDAIMHAHRTQEERLQCLEDMVHPITHFFRVPGDARIVARRGPNLTPGQKSTLP